MELIGRDNDLNQALQAITQGRNVLVIGDGGIGKTAFISALVERIELPCFQIHEGTAKQVLFDLAMQVHAAYGLKLPAGIIPRQTLARAKRVGVLTIDDINRPIYRLKIPDLVQILCDSLAGKHCIVVVNSLEVNPTTANAIKDLLEVVQMVGVMDSSNRRNLIQKMLYKFNQKIELEPLTIFECENIADKHCEGIRFASHYTKSLFIRHISRESDGNPAALMAMLRAAATEDKITPAKVHSMSHEQGHSFMDMSWVVVLLLISFMAYRYISRGMGEMEGYILSGVGSAVVFGLIFVLRKLSTPRA